MLNHGAEGDAAGVRHAIGCESDEPRVRRLAGQFSRAGLACNRRCGACDAPPRALSDHLAHVARHLDAKTFDTGRQERRRCDDADARPHGVEQDDVGARHARMKDVAADCNEQPLDASLVAADC
jgi:hypothetical protein